MKIVLNKIIFFFFIFLLSYLMGCLGGNSNNSSFYSSFYISASYPNIIYPNQQFNINIIMLNNHYKEWALCLASFNSLAYKIVGDLCVNNNEINSDHFSLPYNGYIELVNPNILLNNEQQIIADFCYYGNETLILQGCLEQNQVCNLNVNGNQYPFGISNAYIVYQNGEYYINLEINFLGNSNTTFQYITNQNIINSCNINSINPNNYYFNYTIYYSFGSSIQSVTGVGEINQNTGEGYLTIPIDYNGNQPSAIFILNIIYYTFEELDLGIMQINYNT